MKKKISFFLLLILCGSCKKEADFDTIDPNLVGRWFSEQYLRNSGSSYLFSSDAGFAYENKGGDPSVEDNEEISGEAKFRKDVIYVKRWKFRITHFPERFDTIIRYDIDTMQTHWRVRIARASRLNPGNIKNTEGFWYYR